MLAAYKRGKNLKDMLVHGRLSLANQGPLKKRMNLLVRGKGRKMIRIKQAIPLKQTNCVYLICCLHCGLRYVGETGNSILTRMWGHRSAIKKGTGQEGHLVPHFRRHGVQNVKICGLEHNPDWDKKKRRERERF